jgi:hypothetical protein
MFDSSADFTRTFWLAVIAVHCAVLVLVGIVDFFKRVAR